MPHTAYQDTKSSMEQSTLHKLHKEHSQCGDGVIGLPHLSLTSSTSMSASSTAFPPFTPNMSPSASAYNSFTSLLSPHNSSSGLTCGYPLDSSHLAAMRDDALASMPPMNPSLASASSSALNGSLLQYPLTPVVSSFAQSSASLLDLLNPSSISTSTSTPACVESQEIEMADSSDDDEEDEEKTALVSPASTRATLPSIPTSASVISAASRFHPAPTSNSSSSYKTQTRLDEEEDIGSSDSENDEDYKDEGGNGDEDDGSDDDSSDMDSTSGEDLMEWVSHSRRSGVDARTVLQRLLNDYSHVRVPSKFLWNTAIQLSMHLQQQILTQSTRRVKLPHINTLDDVCGLIKKSQKIVVLTGAGISVAAGIPDFRSKGGIYPRLKKEFGMESPESMFDLDYFRENPQIFYSFAKELWPGAHQPTTTHRFIAMIERQGKLLRNYTQNIDALEARAGIKNVLQCHGSFENAKCMTCKKVVHGMAIHDAIMSQTIAKCPDCHPADAEQRETDGVDRSGKTYGVFKPTITFFGESLPEEFRTCLNQDRDVADLVIVIGSSLSVQPVAGMLEIFNRSTPMVLINREVVGKPHEFDVEILGLADEVCTYISNKLDWTLPPIDANLDMFRQRDTTATTIVASAEDIAPSTTAPVDTVPTPAEPEFCSPNRYCFPGAQVGPTRSLTISTDSDSNSDGYSCSHMDHDASTLGEEEAAEALKLSSPKVSEVVSPEDIIQAQPLDLNEGAPALARTPSAHAHSTSASAVTSALKSPSRHQLGTPIGSPKTDSPRPPPLLLSTPSETNALKSTSNNSDNPNSGVVDLNLVCTPTKSARFQLLSPHLHVNHLQGMTVGLPSSHDLFERNMASPKFRALADPHSTAAGLDSCNTPSTPTLSWAGSKRKPNDETVAANVTSSSSSPPIVAGKGLPSPSVSFVMPPSALGEDSCFVPQVKRRKMEAKPSPLSASPLTAAASLFAAASSSSLSTSDCTVMENSRKVSVEEMKSDEPLPSNATQ